MRKLMVAAAGSLLLAAPLAQADVIGVGAALSYWDSDLSGRIVNNGDAVSVDNDLDLDSSSNTNATLYFEHPIPVLPNIRINYTKVDQSGRGQVGAGGFDGVTGNVRSDLEIEQLDLTLYYEILDNWVNLDLGLTARDLSSELTVSQVGGILSSKTKVDGVVPMGYIAARFDLPFTGVSVGGAGNIISFDGDSLRDFNVYGQFEFALIQLRAGYRQMALDYEDDDNTLDVDIDGPFISAGISF